MRLKLPIVPAMPPVGRLAGALLGAGAAIVVLLVLLVGGCGARGVDEGDYVAHNEAVFRSVPQYPGAVLVNSYSIGIPKPGGLNENGPPYGAFDTWRAYRLSPPVPVQAVIRHFESLPGWGVSVRVGNPTDQVGLRRGMALINVMASDSGYQMSVDYDGYDGPGH